MNNFKKFLATVKTQIRGIADDSRNVKKGYAFVAIRGLNSDGHKFINQARANGAKIVIGESEGVDIKVSDSRKALSLLASAFYDNPSKKLKIIGVTGTDGKTTTSTLICWMLKTAGIKVGLVSTVSAKIGDLEYDTGFHTTNPEPLALQKFLAEMVKAKSKYSILEVTSHGLDQERVHGIKFDIGVLTNITHEHLDYHKTFDNYVKAKAKLFQDSKVCIINKDYYKFFKKYINKNKKVILYDKKVLSDKLSEIINLKFKEEYNVHNAVAAILVAKEIGISEDKIANAIKTFKGVEGRMEEIKNMLGIKIIIDFAHTPNALENVLKTLKEQKNKKSKLITIFGCAGERDIMKRPMMGKISSEIADISIFTTEDPRHEDINDIFGQMLKGVKNKSKNIHLIPDRREAINFAINKIAKRGDIVAICGKGHEKSMNFNGVEHPWSDKEAVTRTLMKKAAVLGLGLEGKDLVNFLLKTGADITIYDERQKEELDLTGIDTNKISIICGVGVFSSDTLNHFETIYRSPGIYRFRKEIKSIENTGVKISSAIKLFFELCPATIIGVTGTKGKGTTSTLIYNILKKANKKVYLAGNIGKPYLSLLSKLKKSDFVVLELSSFQLIDLHKSPHIAVVLNITSDHLDWHKNRDEYVSAKSNVVRFQHKDDFAVINSEYITSKSFSKLTKGKVMYFSKDGLDAKFKKKILLRGEHNLENIAAAVNVARILRISDKVISKSVTGFKGLEHRLELVKSVDQVSFYNDSFSTNPEPTIAAVNSFGNSMTLILGGFDKGLDYQKMGKEIANNSKVNNIILIGDTAEKIKKSLLSNNFKGKIWEMGKTSMKKIVLKAKSTTVKGGIVILSPASASFDMFKDYKERGLLFKEAVYELNKS